MVFDGDALGGDGDGEVVVCVGAVLRFLGLSMCDMGVSRVGWWEGGGTR